MSRQGAIHFRQTKNPSTAMTAMITRAIVHHILSIPKAITESANRFDLMSGLPELFAQALNVRINGARINHTFVTPNFVQQAIALLHTATPLHQQSQEPELDAG